MAGLRSLLFTLGVRPSDDEDTRLAKLLLLSTALMVAVLAVLWGGLYLAFDEPLAAAIPWLYSVLSGISIAVFAIRRSYSWFLASQLSLYLALPFLLMWVLGGYVPGSAVALWAVNAPLVALVLRGWRKALPWLIAFLLLLVVSSFVQPLAGDGVPRLPATLVASLFALNLGGVSAIAFVQLAAFAGGHEGMLRGLRGLANFLSPTVATSFTRNPERLRLGGDVAEVTVLFADLRGFTSYAETHPPDAAVGLLNRYFGVAIPIILRHGGTPIQLAGDQVMAIFNAPHPQPQHALHAARVAVEIHEKLEPVAASVGPDAPQFGIGINTGPALVGNIGSEEFRNFTAIGDTTNIAARLQALAEPRQVVLGPQTAAALQASAHLESLGPIVVKGHARPVEAHRLVALDPGDPPVELAGEQHATA